MMQRRTLRVLCRAGMCSGLLLASCADPFAERVAPTRLPDVALSTRNVSVARTLSDARPAVGQVEVSLASPRINDIRIHVEHTSRAIAMVDVVTRSNTSGIVSIRFRAPSSLGVGVWSDTVTLSFCEDEACQQPLEGSPQVIYAQLVVTPDLREAPAGYR